MRFRVVVKVRVVCFLLLALGGACLGTESDRPEALVQVLAPSETSILFGPTRVEVSVASDLEVQVFRLIGPGHWQRLAPRDGEIVFDAGSDLAMECLEARAYDSRYRLVATDRVCTDYFPRSDAFARAPSYIKAYVQGNSFSVVPPLCYLADWRKIHCIAEPYLDDIAGFARWVEADQCQVRDPVRRMSVRSEAFNSCSQATRRLELLCSRKNRMQPETLRDCRFAGGSCQVEDVESGLSDATIYVDLLVDTSGSMTSCWQELDRGVMWVSEMAERSPYEIKFRIVAFAEGSFLLRPGSGALDDDARRYGYVRDPAVAIDMLDQLRGRGGGTALYNAVWRELEQLSTMAAIDEEQGRASRRVLIIVSDCLDTSSGDARTTQVAGLAGRSGVPVYVIQVGPQRADSTCGQIAKATGGELMVSGREISEHFIDAVRSVADEYRIWFRAPQDIAMNRSHKIAIAAPEGVQVTHPDRWYPPILAIEHAVAAIGDHGLTTLEYFHAASIISRHGDSRTVSKLLTAFTRYRRQLARNSRKKWIASETLPDFEKRLGLEQDGHYLARRSATFSAVVAQVKRGLLHGSAREQERSARLVARVRAMLGPPGEGYSLEPMLGPFFDTFLDPDFPANKTAGRLIRRIRQGPK